MKKKQSGFSIIELLIIFVVIGLIVGAGWYVMQSKKKPLATTKAAVSPEQAFKNYLTTQSKLTKTAFSETFSGTGTNVKSKASIDVSGKKFNVTADLDCSAQIDNKPISVKMNVQYENTIIYIRFNEVNGDVTNYQTGQVRKLDTVFSKAKGVWYKLPDDQAQKSQLDSGIFVFGSAIIAPGTDTSNLADTLLTKGVFKITSNSKDGDNQILNITSSKSAYLDVLKSVFPKLTSPDIIISNMFKDATSRDSTITINNNGKLVQEKSTQNNVCFDAVNGYIGNQFTGLTKDVSVTSTPISYDEVKIIPITDSKPVANFARDLVL